MGESVIKSPSDQLRDAWQDGPYGSVVLYGADLIDEQVKTIKSLRSELEASRHRVAELEAIRDAVKPLVDACVKEFTSKSTEEGEKPCDDDEGVAFDMYPYKCQITFGMIRRARSTLD